MADQPLGELDVIVSADWSELQDAFSQIETAGQAAADVDALAEAGLDVRNAFNFAPGTHDSPVNSLGPAPNVSHCAWADWQFDAAVIIGFSALVAAFGILMQLCDH